LAAAHAPAVRNVLEDGVLGEGQPEPLDVELFEQRHLARVVLLDLHVQFRGHRPDRRVRRCPGRCGERGGGHASSYSALAVGASLPGATCSVCGTGACAGIGPTEPAFGRAADQRRITGRSTSSYRPQARIRLTTNVPMRNAM